MDVFKTLILDTPTVEGATGTVTSVDLTAGTGISVSGGPITSSGSINVTNTAPDQTVALTGGTGISTSGTYPNFTITNDAPDQTVSIASGTGISVTGTYPSFTVTNSSPSLGGDVVGPASATDNAVVRFDSTTGKLVQNSGVSISDANLLTTAALTVNDNTTLGSSNTDTVTFNARSASEFTPATDDTYDLGRVGHEWRDLFINGTANIDSLVADTADVNGGTIDGATIGATTASSGAFTTLSATGALSTTTSALVSNNGDTASANYPSTNTRLGGSYDGQFITTMLSYGANAAIVQGATGGTKASPTQTVSGTSLMILGGYGYNTTNGWGNGTGTSNARMVFAATENHTNTAQGANIFFDVTPNTTTSRITAMTIDQSGDVLIGTTSAFSGGYNAARKYLEIKGSSSTGVLGFATGQADGDGNLAGLTEFHDLNSTSGSTRVGYIATRLRGATANNRGSGIAFAVKTDNSATVAEVAEFLPTGLAVVGDITATGNITAYYSDDRLKTKLGNIENALDKVSKLNGFYYEANETAQALGYKPVREVGLSAQQVEAVLPEVVAPAPIDNEYKTLHYERVIPLLVEAIKELKAEIELLKK